RTLVSQGVGRHVVHRADINDIKRLGMSRAEGPSAQRGFGDGWMGPRPLTTSPVSMSEMRFGDFDGDGLTDMSYTRDRQWRIWYGNLKDWRDAQNSGFPISDLLFGEFDAVKGTDVAAVTGGKWQMSSAALSSWTVLNPAQSRSFRGAVVADFDGDGRG